MRMKFVKRFAEFFVIGLLFGVVEDLIAIRSVSDTLITWEVLGIVALVALPFAVISELLVDGKDIFRHHL
jgi:hypothetical protein